MPQLVCVLHFSLIRTLQEFKKLTIDVFDSNIISYSSIAVEVRDLNQLPLAMRASAVQYFCNEEDLKPDHERVGINVIDNP